MCDHGLDGCHGRGGGVIDATIAICTRNRATVLTQCLTSVATQVAEPGQVEVLVVDNGSTDDTAELLRGWQDSGGGRRVVTERRTGLARARNTALDASEREVVIFTDDDALTPPGWARAHVAAYEDPSVGAAGGPIGLLWPDERPPWVTDELAGWYGALDLGDESCPFPTVHGPYGVNMSVRRKAALAAGGYDPQLGRRGSSLLSGEEPDLTRRLVDAGWSIRYVAEAGLVHQVAPERIRQRWLLRRGWAQGITNARREALADHPSRRRRLGRAKDELVEAPSHWRERRAGDDLFAAGTRRGGRRCRARVPAADHPPGGRTGAMTLSVCCLTRDRPAIVAAMLSLYRPVADEIVVAVDAARRPGDARPVARRRRHRAPVRVPGHPRAGPAVAGRAVPQRRRPDGRRRRGPERGPARRAPRTRGRRWCAAVPHRPPLVLPRRAALAGRATVVAGLPAPSRPARTAARLRHRLPRRRPRGDSVPPRAGAALPPGVRRQDVRRASPRRTPVRSRATGDDRGGRWTDEPGPLRPRALRHAATRTPRPPRT